MQTIELQAYRTVAAANKTYTAVYAEIIQALKENTKVKIDFSNVIAISPAFAKEVFGKLYVELGSERFFEHVIITNANDKIDLLIKVEIQNSIDKKCYKLVW